MITKNSEAYKIIQSMANPVEAERDYMECRILAEMFEDETAMDTLIFTGGATLSKAYNICPRRSHDLDLASTEFEELPDTRSKRQLTKYKNNFKNFVFDVLMPRINYIINQDKQFMLSTDRAWRALHNPEQQSSYPTLHLLYQSAFENAFQHICIEIIPRKYDVDNISFRTVTPYSTRRAMGTIPTVAYEQTFWDKIFAIHSVATGGAPQNRFFLSRHYYDVAQMSPLVNLDTTRHMLQNTISYQQIYTTKNILPINSLADLRLLPAPEVLIDINQDYDSMRQEQFLAPAPHWNQILQRIRDLQAKCNLVGKKQQGR